MSLRAIAERLCTAPFGPRRDVSGIERTVTVAAEVADLADAITAIGAPGDGGPGSEEFIDDLARQARRVGSFRPALGWGPMGPPTDRPAVRWGAGCPNGHAGAGKHERTDGPSEGENGRCDDEADGDGGRGGVGRGVPEATLRNRGDD